MTDRVRVRLSKETGSKDQPKSFLPFLRTPFVVESPLRTRLKVVTFLVGIGVCSLLLAGEGIRIAVATKLGESLRLAEIRKAVSFDRENPEFHFRLGLAETYSLEGSNSAEGIRQLQRATDLSPHETRYWSALASACELAGKSACASHAISQTLTLSPMTPRLHWEAANYYLRANQQALALGQFHRLLEIDLGYAGATFRICLQVTGDPDTVDRSVLTPAASPELKLAYVNFLTSQGNEGFAYQVWKEVATSRAPFSFLLADPYLEHLIVTGKYQEATAVWRELQRRGIVKKPDDDPGNLVFNGSFKQAPLNAGFGWRYRQQPYLSFTFGDTGPYEGTGSLRLDFTVSEDGEYEPVFQLDPATPNQTYRLTASVRSQDITSPSGPRLRVIDPACPACLTVATDMTVGTTPWHKITLDFSTGPKTQLVRLSVWRPKAVAFPPEITGTFWVSQVSLTSVPSLTRQAMRSGKT